MPNEGLIIRYRSTSHEIIIDFHHTFFSTASNVLVIWGDLEIEALKISHTIDLFVEQKLVEGNSIEFKFGGSW